MLFDQEKDPVQIIKWKENHSRLWEYATDKCETWPTSSETVTLKKTLEPHLPPGGPAGTKEAWL